MRTVCVAIAALGLLAGSAIGVAAQAADPNAGLPVAVEGNTMCEVVDRGTYGSSSPAVQGAYGVKDQVLDCVSELSDPRVSGPVTVTFNDACFPPEQPTECVAWGTSSGGDTGGWDCSYAGMTDPMGDNDVVTLGICAGTGDYAGLVYVYQAALSFAGVGDFGDGTNSKGIIYEGVPPPMALPPAE